MNIHIYTYTRSHTHVHARIHRVTRARTRTRCSFVPQLRCRLACFARVATPHAQESRRDCGSWPRENDARHLSSRASVHARLLFSTRFFLKRRENPIEAISCTVRDCGRERGCKQGLRTGWGAGRRIAARDCVAIPPNEFSAYVTIFTNLCENTWDVNGCLR